MMRRLKLTVNEAKTRTCRLPDESFEFLGYTIGRCYSPRTGRAYYGTRPSKRKVQRLFREISELTNRRWTWLETEEQVGRINQKLNGWANYFCLGSVSQAYAAVDAHVNRRLRQWLCSKHRVRGLGISRYPDKYLYQQLGLVRLSVRRRNFSWATT
jgi:hypothetical protein